ncbi:MAG: hypothetical protein PHH59_04210 [Methylovulum sp.]|uniref:hypothetical protein n=1 Tax=Methylovulum sp. TaxID=1916980 RepID=UPI002625F335|nr:hypothetical protein [Methylovulum sp.]MDD2723213.1 hypothetical protein [Methylovulum sp.]MDD5123154.1 hypothetical protein [Methylovulum sp.]
MSKTYIFLRQSPDWKSISDSEFRKQSREFCALMGRPPEQVNLSADLWNKTFKRSFIDIRQEIKEIALSNFAMVEDAELFNGLEPPESLVSEKSFYFFTDDDDWVHPKITSLLANVDHSDQVGGIVWGSVAFGTHREKIIVRRNIDGYCFTNNYAITGQYLAKTPENFITVSQHGGADGFLESRNSKKIINEYWSVTNKNPTSTIFLEQLLKGDFSSQQKLSSGVECYVHRCKQIDLEIDGSLEWARPLMDRMLGIFSELL